MNASAERNKTTPMKPTVWPVKHPLSNFHGSSLTSATAGTTAQQETLVPEAGLGSLQLQGWRLTGAGAGGRRA